MGVRVNGKGLFPWMIRVHFEAYRAVNDNILRIGSIAYNGIARIPLVQSSLGMIGRKVSDNHEVQYVKATTCRLVNGLVTAICSQSCFEEDTLKTQVQKNRELEIVEMQNRFGNDSAYPKFSKATAELISELFRKQISCLLLEIPPLAESVTLYKLGLTFRYINYKLNQRTGYRDKFLSSDLGGYLDRVYCIFRTNLTHSLLSDANVSPIINFEHIFLKLFTKIHPKLTQKPEGITNNDVLIHTLAESLNLMERSDSEIMAQSFSSEDEAFIARLHWYKRNGVLPPGVPDPDKVSLNTGNLAKSLDEAMFSYLDEVSEEIIDTVVPKKQKSKVLRILYWLEGRDGLIQVLSFLIGELGINQVADPHLFALAVLNARGVEVADYELNGFGRGKADIILKVGEQMLKDMNDGIASTSDIISVFKNSTLKQSPGSYEAILQKREAKQELKKYISNAIYSLIKEDDFKHDGLLKGVRETMQQLPILGTATTGMHLLFNGMFFSLNYFFSDRQNISFFSHVTRHLSGRKLADFLTNRVMALIYHPAWRLVILQSVENLRNHLKKSKDPEYKLKKLDSIGDLRTISTFLMKHMTTDFPVKLDALTNFIITDDLLKQFRVYLKPSGKPIIEVAIESLVPTIKELLLYWKISEAFRKSGINFDGDEKFWEIYIREYLARLVLLKEKDTGSLSLEQKMQYRNEVVEGLLALSEKEQRRQIVKNIEVIKNQYPEVKEFLEFQLIDDYVIQNDNEEIEKFEVVVEASLSESNYPSDEFDNFVLVEDFSPQDANHNKSRD
ncbi:MAG: hypothetical protein VX777_04300 [Chlamydiota bacterium]|nr:hypothetical protein [Chlamydiota bacterium]